MTYHTLDDEDPTPTVEPGDSLHLHEAKSQDTSTSGGNASQDVEAGVAFAHVI